MTGLLRPWMLKAASPSGGLNWKKDRIITSQK